MEKNSKIYIAGNTGLVGSAIERELKKQGYANIIGNASKEIDLRNQKRVEEFFEQNHPEYVFMAAAKVGGVKANVEYPADFIYDNTQIQNNLIMSAWRNGVKKFCFLGSNCIYPKAAPQPYKEESFLQGRVEETNEPYAIAKINGIKLGQSLNIQHGFNFITVIPASLFGPNDNFDLQQSHLVPALIRKFHEAKLNNKEVQLWGTGESRREIMHVDDAAKACIFLMNNYDSLEIVNVGVDQDYSIKEIAEIVKKVTDYNGKINFEGGERSGIKRKLLDSTKARLLGWKPDLNIEEGLKKTYEWFKENYDSLN